MWLVSWVLRPLLILGGVVMLFRVRAADPNRQSLVQPILVLLGLLSLAVFLFVFAVGNLGMALSEGQDVSEIVLRVIVGLGALIGLAFVLVRLVKNMRVLSRETGGQSIRLVDYLDAPRDARKSLRRIAKSARSVRSGEACARGLIDDRELQQLVYSAAQQAVLSSELNTSVRELRTSDEPADREAVREAEERIADVCRHLKEVEDRLGKAAASAHQISTVITAPERQQQKLQEDVQARAADELRHQKARGRMRQASLAAPAPATEQVVAFEEAVTALHLGYQEVGEVSERTLKGPQLPAESVATAGEDHDLGKNAGEIAKLTGGWLGRASLSAGKYGARKMRQRMRRER